MNIEKKPKIQKTVVKKTNPFVKEFVDFLSGMGIVASEEKISSVGELSGNKRKDIEKILNHLGIGISERKLEEFLNATGKGK